MSYLSNIYFFVFEDLRVTYGIYITLHEIIFPLTFCVTCFQPQCLTIPQKPQYNGGIIQNPEINDGLQGWTSFGQAKIQHRESLGNKYVVAHSRNQPYDSVSQKIHLEKGMYYTLSGEIYGRKLEFTFNILLIVNVLHCQQIICTNLYVVMNKINRF